jgi:hypothetical protein
LVFVYYSLILEKTAPKNIYGVGLGGLLFVLNINVFDISGCGLNVARMAAYGWIAQ